MCSRPQTPDARVEALVHRGRAATACSATSVMCSGAEAAPSWTPRGSAAFSSTLIVMGVPQGNSSNPSRSRASGTNAFQGSCAACNRASSKRLNQRRPASAPVSGARQFLGQVQLRDAGVGDVFLPLSKFSILRGSTAKPSKSK